MLRLSVQRLLYDSMEHILQNGYLEERLLHAPAALDGQSLPGVQDAREEGAGVVDVVRAHRPSHLLLPRPENHADADINTHKRTRALSMHQWRRLDV